MASTKVNSVKSVDHALSVLEKLKENSQGMGVTELSVRLELSKSTVHRLLMSLSAKNYVRQEPITKKYNLGLKFIEIGEHVNESLDIRKIAAPQLAELSRKTKETVHLVVMENFEAVYIDRVESDSTIRMYSRIGKRLPMHCTGAGKVFLAHLPPKSWELFLEGNQLIEFTGNTLISERVLLTQLKLIKKNGFAIDDEEYEAGVKCIAVPIRDLHGEVIATISVSIPAIRFTEEGIDSIIKILKDASHKISGELGNFIL